MLNKRIARSIASCVLLILLLLNCTSCLSVTLSGVGVSKLSKISIFNLDSNMTIEARNFNAETDVMQPWVKRKSIQGNGCGSVIGVSATLAALLPAAWILKRKENENE